MYQFKVEKFRVRHQGQQNNLEKIEINRDDKKHDK
jgi:hypothetical protein